MFKKKSYNIPKGGEEEYLVERILGRGVVLGGILTGTDPGDPGLQLCTWWTQ